MIDAPFAAPLGDVSVADVEEAFFNEGIDGHAESLPSDPEAVTVPLAPIAAPLGLEEEAEQGADVEDPARARRRQAARIGVGWGAALLLGVAGASAFLSPHGRERSAVTLATTEAPVQPTLSAPAVTPVAATPLSQVSASASSALQPAAAVTPSRPPVHVTTASIKAAGAARPRAAAHKKGAAPSHGAKASAASPKASSARASQTSKPTTRGAAPKVQRRGSMTAGASAKTSN